jgi:ABC-type uncharacterized transport system involved in gliding motility auxiliary subunit
VDPDRNPARTKDAGITRYGTVVVEATGQSEKIFDLTEEKMTNAIIHVTKPGKKVIYFLEGHGERDLDSVEKNGYSQVKTTLEDLNYEVKDLLLMKQREMPRDAAVLVVAGPKKDLFPEELKTIERYLKSGGKVMFLIDPETVPLMSEYFEQFNVKLGEDIIIDKLSRLFRGDYLTPVVTNYTEHPAVENFNVATFFPLARSISVIDKKNDDVTTEVLAQTGRQAWAETDFAALKRGRAQFVKGQDLAGPISVSVVGTITVSDRLEPETTTDEKSKTERAGPRTGYGKFIVFGDSDFAANSYFGVSGNGDLFTNALSWLAEEADLVAIKPKQEKSQPLMLTAIEAKLFFWLPVVVLPLVVLVFGAVVWTGRRRPS